LFSKLIAEDLPKTAAKTLLYRRLALDLEDRLDDNQNQDFGGVLSIKNGATADACDSLLFTGLSSYAHGRLSRDTSSDTAARIHLKEAAKKDVDAILRSILISRDGRPVRHRLCQDMGLSRDMAMGVALASLGLDLEQRERPFDRSAGIEADRLRRAMLDSWVAGAGIFLSPWSRVKKGSSLINTTVIEMLFPGSPLLPFFLSNDAILFVDEPRGFVTHLNALTVLFELEALKVGIKPKTILDNPASRLVMTDEDLRPGRYERLLRIARTITRVDPQNLFFRAILYRAVTDAAEEEIYALPLDENRLAGLAYIRRGFAASILMGLRSLEERGYFPDDRLPASEPGPRDQEYLWQRDSSSWERSGPSGALSVWPGVDYAMLIAVLSSLL
jgi:hypothetical protein